MGLEELRTESAPMCYDLGVWEGKLVLYLNAEVESKARELTTFPDDDGRQYSFHDIFERVESLNYDVMRAWRLRTEVISEQKNKTARDQKAHACCEMLGKVLFWVNLYLSDVASSLSAISLRQYLDLSVGSSREAQHSGYGIDGWISIPFLEWLQGKKVTSVLSAREAMITTAESIIPLFKPKDYDFSTIIGGDRAFQVNISGMFGTCFSTYCDCRYRLDSGNMHAPYYSIIALTGFAVICDQYRR